MSVIKKIFEEFENLEIKYVHFKSNTHLKDSFHGKGDFDILIDPQNLSLVEEVILHNSGKRFNSFHYGRYPGVDNWLVFDQDTGKISHLHLHCQITTGKAQVKDYVIPWSKYILESKVKNKEWDIYVTNPNVEILLLLIRIIVKSNYKDFIKACFGLYKMHSDLLEEWEQLLNIIDSPTMEDHIEKLFPDSATELIKRIIQKDNISSLDYLKLNFIIRKLLKNNRRMTAFSASFFSVKGKYMMKAAYMKKARKVGHQTIKKTSMSGGAIIAFVGVDGAGKSTVVKEVEKWLTHKIDCRRYYMGEGDGDTTLLVKLTKKILNKRKTLAKKSGISVAKVSLKTDSNVKSLQVSLVEYLGIMLRAIMISSIQKQNYKKICQMNKLKLEGGLSILDRFPQLECDGKNDGPKIKQLYSKLPNSLIIHRFLKLENSYLGIVKEVKPDLVIRLNISAEESMKRKPEQTNIFEFQKKIDDLSNITFQGANIIDVNAQQDYMTELLEIKTLIWKHL